MKKFIILIILLILYLLISSYFHFYIPCPFKEITGFYCPGCGITRMLLSILKLDFYGAFRYNPLLFISIPIGLYIYIDYLIRKEKSLYKKIPEKGWYVVIIIFIIYGILRNIPAFDFLAPTTI